MFIQNEYILLILYVIIAIYLLVTVANKSLHSTFYVPIHIFTFIQLYHDILYYCSIVEEKSIAIGVICHSTSTLIHKFRVLISKGTNAILCLSSDIDIGKTGHR